MTAQPPADPRYARIPAHLEQQTIGVAQPRELSQTLLGIDHHRAELAQGERLAVLAYSCLAEESRAAIAELDGGGDDEEEGREQGQRGPGDGAVERGLDQPSGASELGVIHVQ